MAIAFDSADPSDANSASGAGTTSLTSTNFTISSGANRVAIGFDCTGDSTGANPTGMKWQGSSGTALTQHGATLSIGTHAKLSTWKLTAPAAAVGAAYGNWSATQGEACIPMVAYTGVDQTTPLGTAATAVGNTDAAGNATATVNITTVVGDLVVAAVFLHNAATSSNPTIAANQGTERYKAQTTAIGGFGAVVVWDFVATATTTTMSAAIASAEHGLTNAWGITAAVVNPAAGGGGSAAADGYQSLNRNRPGRGPYSLGLYYRPIGDMGMVATTGAAYADAVAEALSLTDTQAAQFVVSGAAAESLTFTDAQTGILATATAIAEAFTLADSQAATEIGTVAAAEALTLADSQSAASAIAAARAESFTLADAQTVASVYVGAQAESLTFADTEAAAGVFVAAVAESLTFADTETGVIAGATTVLEALGLADSQAGTFVVAVARAEALTFSDAQTGIVGIATAVADAITFADSQAASEIRDAVQAEALTFADLQTTQFVGLGAVVDTLAFADAMTGSLSVVSGSVSEYLTFIDRQTAASLLDLVVHARIPSDGVPLSRRTRPDALSTRRRRN